jgi:hypothetical protein
MITLDAILADDLSAWWPPEREWASTNPMTRGYGTGWIGYDDPEMETRP